MTRTETLRRIAHGGLIPVVRAPSADDALRVIDALKEGGVDVIELTMTVPGALKVIEELARRYGVAVLPGALTPTEIVRAWRIGADMVKVFPCGAMGGAAYVRSLKAPLPQI